MISMHIQVWTLCGMRRKFISSLFTQEGLVSESSNAVAGGGQLAVGCGASSLPCKGSVSSRARGHQATWLFKDPVHSFHSLCP